MQIDPCGWEVAEQSGHCSTSSVKERTARQGRKREDRMNNQAREEER